MHKRTPHPTYQTGNRPRGKLGNAVRVTNSSEAKLYKFVFYKPTSAVCQSGGSTKSLDLHTQHHGAFDQNENR